MSRTPPPLGPLARLHRVDLDGSVVRVLRSIGVVQDWSEMHRRQRIVCDSSGELLGGSARKRQLRMGSGRPPTDLHLSQPTVGVDGTRRNPGFRNRAPQSGRWNVALLSGSVASRRLDRHTDASKSSVSRATQSQLSYATAPMHLFSEIREQGTNRFGRLALPRSAAGRRWVRRRSSARREWLLGRCASGRERAVARRSCPAW